MSLFQLFSDTEKEKFKRELPTIDFDSSLPSIYEPQQVSTGSKVKGSKKRKRKVETDKVEETVVPDPETVPVSEGDVDNKDDRTLFVGNLSTEESSKSIKTLFHDYGDIQSIRIRSVPISGTAVDETGNQRLVKKVCVNSKLLGSQKGSFNAYIVFEKKESIAMAMSLNNEVVNGRHIRVDRLKPSMFDPKRSVFLGNLPHYADEEEIRNHFAAVLPNSHSDIEGIRIVRDPETLVGKGIGYLLLKDADAVSFALRLHEALYKKRFKLRVTTCGKRTKRSTTKEKDPSLKKPKFISNASRRILSKTRKHK